MEIHFITKCAFLNDLREPLLSACAKLKPQFGYYTDEEKFIFIMTTPTLTGNVSNFIDLALKEREVLLDVSGVIDDMVDNICIKSK